MWSGALRAPGSPRCSDADEHIGLIKCSVSCRRTFWHANWKSCRSNRSLLIYWWPRVAHLLAEHPFHNDAFYQRKWRLLVCLFLRDPHHPAVHLTSPYMVTRGYFHFRDKPAFLNVGKIVSVNKLTVNNSEPDKSLTCVVIHYWFWSLPCAEIYPDSLNLLVISCNTDEDSTEFLRGQRQIFLFYFIQDLWIAKFDFEKTQKCVKIFMISSRSSCLLGRRDVWVQTVWIYGESALSPVIHGGINLITIFL